MKRSEMVILLNGLFDTLIDVPNSSYLTEKGKNPGEHILREIESAGMFPPFYKTYYIADGGFIWEPENEA